VVEWSICIHYLAQNVWGRQAAFESADSVFHEQHQRFSEVLVLLSKTLAIPDSMLLQLSEPDVHEFALGLDQVWCLQILYCRMKLHSCKRTSGVLWLMTVQILTTGEG
jgi:hypothetical protein